MRVDNLDDWSVWAESQIERSGGYLQDPDYLLLDELVNGAGERVAFQIPKQRLQFWDGSFLDFRMTVRSNVEVERYTFHFVDPDGKMVWRLDKHPGPHVVINRTDTHIHRVDDESYHEPFPEVALNEVIDYIHAYQHDGRLP